MSNFTVIAMRGTAGADFGTGQVHINTKIVEGEVGVVTLRECEPVAIGARSGIKGVANQDTIVLSFLNIESLDVFMDTLQELKKVMEKRR